MDEFKLLLRSVDDYYEGFEMGVVSYIKQSNDPERQHLIEDYILSHPQANTSDILLYMIKETGFYDIYPCFVDIRDMAI